MNGRYHLRRSIGRWSAGTMVTRRGEPGETEVMVSPWGRPDVTFAVSPDDLVRRRGGGGATRPPKAPEPKKNKAPHLVFSTPPAAQSAAKLIPGAAIENVVAKALADGAAHRNPDGTIRVRVGAGVTAIVDRTESRFTGKPAYLVLAVRAA